MGFTEIVLIFVVAFLLALLLVGALGWRGVGDEALWPAVTFILLILFPALWVAHLWLQPAGPELIGVYWLPLLVVGVIVILMLAATRPPRPRAPVIEVGGEPPPPSATETAYGMFFWLLLILLVIAIIAGYAAR